MSVTEITKKKPRFRSPLDRRWAEYLTTCRIQWSYEPEKIMLPSGEFTPRFHLYKTWLEIVAKKPAEGSLILRRCQDLADATKNKVHLVWGPAPTNGNPAEGTMFSPKDKSKATETIRSAA